jgi:hypothetical protein
MSSYNVDGLIAIFRDKDSLCTDGYLRFCESVDGARYLKRDFLYRSGKWRSQEITAFFRDRKRSDGVLVLGHADQYTGYKDIVCIRATGVHSIFGTNCAVVRGISQCLPLGLTNLCDDSPIHKIMGLTTPFIEVLEDDSSPHSFNNSVLLSFNKQTAEKQRVALYNQFHKQSCVTTFTLDYSVAGRLAYLQSIRDHDFVLCPQGNGRDTHRLWETLYLGSIPIVKRRDMPEGLLNLFPIWIVNDWSEALNPDTRATARENLLKHDWDENRLRQSYWNSIIASHLK